MQGLLHLIHPVKLIPRTVSGSIKAANGMCGGIAAINQAGAKIIGCGIANVSKISVQGNAPTLVV